MPWPGLIEPLDEAGDAALTGAGPSRHSHRLPRLGRVKSTSCRHRVGGVIAEADVLELDLSFDRRQIGRVGAVLDLRLNVDQLEDAHAGGHRPLDLGVHRGDLLDGVREPLDVEQEADEEADLHLVVEHLEAAEDEHEYVGGIGQHLGDRHDGALELGRPLVGVQVGLVHRVEVLDVDRLAGEALRDPYARDALLEVVVDEGDRLASGDESPPGVYLPDDHHRDEHRQSCSVRAGPAAS